MVNIPTIKYKSKNGKKFLIVIPPSQANVLQEINFVACNDNMTEQIFSVVFQVDIFTRNQLYPILNNQPLDEILLRAGLKIVKEKINNNDLGSSTVVNKDIIELVRNNLSVNSQEDNYLAKIKIQQDILACLYERVDSIATLKEIADYVWCDSKLLSSELFYLDAEGFISCPPLNKENEEGRTVMSIKGKARYEEIMKNEILKTF